jgi:hypothetical protein
VIAQSRFQWDDGQESSAGHNEMKRIELVLVRKERGSKQKENASLMI